MAGRASLVGPSVSACTYVLTHCLYIDMCTLNSMYWDCVYFIPILRTLSTYVCMYCLCSSVWSTVATTLFKGIQSEAIECMYTTFILCKYCQCIQYEQLNECFSYSKDLDTV